MAKKHSPKFLSIVEQARSMIPECDAVQLREMLADGHPLVVLDVREAHEYEAGHLTGSIHIGKGVLERDIENHGFPTMPVLCCTAEEAFAAPSPPSH